MNRAGRRLICGYLVVVGCDAKDISSLSSTCPMALPSRGARAGVLACREQADCPAGTACWSGESGRGDGSAATGAPCSGTGPCACRPERFPSASKDQLIRGFSADEFDLVVTPGEPSQFSWAQPYGASSVTCGLFVASPDARGAALGHIRNDSQALYRTHLFKLDDRSGRATQFVTFRVADMRTLHEPRACEMIGRLQPAAAAPAYPIVSSLRVGCWASDTSGVVAATQLQDVSISDIPETSLPVTECTGVEQQLEGRYCYPRASTGICQAQECRPLPQVAPSTPKETPATGGGGQSAAGEAGGGASGGLDDDVGSESAAPVDSCADELDNVLCKRDPDFKFGRCIAGFCNPTPNSSPTLDLPLLVSSCAPQTDASADTNWLNCFDVGMQGFGTCLDGHCRQRCLDESDCTRGDAGVCLGQVVSSHALDCFARQEPTALGVCITATEVAKLCASE